MGCGCGGKSTRGGQVAYQVKFKDGSATNFNSSQEATAAIRKAGGGTMRAVPVGQTASR